MKTVVMGILLLCFSVFANDSFDSKDGQIQAQAETIQKLIQEIKIQKSTELFSKSLNHDCDDEDPNVQCVQQCSVRSSTGRCLSYESDYCGVNAVCAENCSVRSSTGRCLSYSADHCGNNAVCMENCSVRSSTGRCLSYGADICY